MLFSDRGVVPGGIAPPETGLGHRTLCGIFSHCSRDRGRPVRDRYFFAAVDPTYPYRMLNARIAVIAADTDGVAKTVA